MWTVGVCVVEVAAPARPTDGPGAGGRASGLVGGPGGQECVDVLDSPVRERLARLGPGRRRGPGELGGRAGEAGRRGRLEYPAECGERGSVDEMRVGRCLAGREHGLWSDSCRLGP